MKDRGLKGIEPVISDRHRGIQTAVLKSFVGAAWQFCHVHFLRNTMKLIPKKRSSVSPIVKETLENEDLLLTAQETLTKE